MRRSLKITGTLVVLAVVLAACGHDKKQPAASVAETQSEKAAVAANSINFGDNAEIANITRRLELTSKPGLQGFISLLNETGQVVWYGGIKGKPTSGSKRLTPRQMLLRGDRGDYNGDFVVQAPSDEGTHGSSSPYIFFWTTASDQYMQWSGTYLYSDQPFRLTVQPIMLSIVDDSEDRTTAN